MSGKKSRPTDLRSRALRGIGWTVIEKWGIRLVSLVVFTILLRTIDAEDFGLASLATSISMILLVFVDAGFAKALVQRKSLGPDDATTAFWTSCAFAIALYIAIFFSAPLFESLLGMQDLGLVLRVLGLSVLVPAVSSTPAALLERDMNFKSLGLRSMIGTVVGAAIAVPMAIYGAGVWALVAQTLSSMIAGAVALWFSTDWRPSFRYSISAFRAMWGFGMSFLGLELLTRIQQYTDKILVTALLGAEIGGIYYIAQRGVSLVLELVSSVISRIALTTFAKMQDDRERLNRAFLQLTFAAGAVAIPILGIVTALAGIIMPYLSGDDRWDQAVPVMQILAVGSSLFVLSRFDKQIMLASGNAGRAFTLGLVESFIGIALLFAGAPFGLVGVAIGRASRVLCTLPYRLYLLKRHVGISVVSHLANAARLYGAMVIPVGLLLILSFTPWRDTAPAFWTFAFPVSIVMFIAYSCVLWLICGQRNRESIWRTLRPGRSSGAATSPTKGIQEPGR